MAALTTLAKLKQYGQVSSFEDDTLLVRMIDAASAAIERYCSRVFALATYTEVRDGEGQRKLFMRRFPVTSVLSLTINGRSIPSRPSPLSPGYTFDDLTIRLTEYRFEEGIDNIVVSYTAGLAAVPADVEEACCEVVMRRYKQRDRIGVESKSLAGESISFDPDDFPAHIVRVLDRYRVVGLP